MNHTCYIEGGSIINAYTGAIIENPAIVVSGDTLIGWGDMEDMKPKFDRSAYGYSQAGFTDELESLMLIELSGYKLDRETACYVMRRASEFTATGFIENLCVKLKGGTDPAEWLKSEMERVPVDLYEKEQR